MRRALTRLLLFATAAASAVALPSLHAQSSQTSNQKAPAFEVASIKRNRSGDQRSGFNTPANRFIATNVALHDLIAWAYGEPGPPPELRPDFRMSGGQGWITTDRFDVEATTGSEVPDGVERTRLKMRMLQTLLAERFKLSTHHETREGPVYSLVLANRDGRLGPQLRRSSVDCNAMMARGRANAGAPPPPPPGPPAPGQVPPCGIRIGLGGLRIGSQSLSAIARLLSRATGRPVIDRTTVDGAFDLSLDFDPSGLPGFDRPPGAPPIDIGDKPSMFTALQEQAGLKLEAGRGPIDILVIEAAEHPADN
jgi:uncharacterized protein (TIGR03435 family)